MASSASVPRRNHTELAVLTRRRTRPVAGSIRNPLPIRTPAELTAERPPQGTVTGACEPGSSASEHVPRCGHVYTHPAVDPIAGVNVWW